MVKHLTARFIALAVIACSFASMIPAQSKSLDRTVFEKDPSTVISAVCAAGELGTNGDCDEVGTPGNARTFNMGDVAVRSRAFSRRRTDGLWETGFLGSFCYAGLGVTNRGEGNGENEQHRLDNGGDRLDYILFEFNQDVVIDRIYLDSVFGDSDISVWVGSSLNAYNNPITLTDSVLAGFGPAEVNTGGSADRWANVNSTNKIGNVLVVATRVDDTARNDGVKVRFLDIDCPPSRAQVLIIKEVQTIAGATMANQAFAFTATNFGVSNFSLKDLNVAGPDRIGTSNITQFGAANAITVTESITGGWTLAEAPSCVETGGIQNTTVSFANRRVNIIPEAGETIVCTFRNTQFTPSAAIAPISGRVTAASGNGIRGAVLTLLNLESGETRIAQTGAFGYYSFEAEVGATYLLTIEHKRHFFSDSTRVISHNDELSGVDFVEAF